MKHVGGIVVGKKFIEAEEGVTEDSAFCEKPFFARSRANSRGHWRLQAARDKEARTVGQSMAFVCIKQGARAFGWQKDHDACWAVTFTRYTNAKMLDGDNLLASFKSIRDGVADVLGTGDGWEGRVEWHYDQKGGKRGHGVRIELKRLNLP